jgi:hypothetical protein
MIIITKAPMSVRIKASVDIEKMAEDPGNFETLLFKSEAKVKRENGIMAIMTEIKSRNRRDTLVPKDLKRLSMKQQL